MNAHAERRTFSHTRLPLPWRIWRRIQRDDFFDLAAQTSSLTIDFVNFVLPNVKRPWRWLSPGTIFVVLTLVVSAVGFNLYFEYFSSYPQIYGAIGWFILLTLWIYLASVILLVGAEADSEIEAFASERGSR